MRAVILVTTSLFFVATTIACWSTSDEFTGWGVSKQTRPVPEGYPPGTRCATTYATQPCLCYYNAAGIPGRQVCLDNGSWDECECEGTSDGGDSSGYDSFKNKIPLYFNWQRTVPVGGSCKAGRYDGEFDGIYIPAITFGFGPIPVFGNLIFRLEKSSIGEFFLVKDGHMIGAALVAFVFEGEIIGTLDCESRTFVGELKNCHYVIPGLPPFAFEGVIEAQYDRFNNTFVNGVWSVTEIDATGNFPDPLPVSPGVPVPFPPPFGGTGTWTNHWVQ